jgi:hypothetical protein
MTVQVQHHIFAEAGFAGIESAPAYGIFTLPHFKQTYYKPFIAQFSPNLRILERGAGSDETCFPLWRKSGKEMCIGSLRRQFAATLLPVGSSRRDADSSRKDRQVGS